MKNSTYFSGKFEKSNFNKTLESIIKKVGKNFKHAFRYGVFIPVVYFMSQGGVFAQSSPETPVDSITASYGGPENRGPNASRQPVWELKDGVPQVRDTIDFGKVYTVSGPSVIPDLIYGSGFGVDGTGKEYDTVYVTGRVYRWPEDTPLKGAGVNLFDAHYPLDTIDPWNSWRDGEFLGRYYLDSAKHMETDSNGVFYERLRLPVKKDNIVVTGIKTEKSVLPKKFELKQNYPNPFNPSTTIEYSLSEQVKGVEMDIYNIQGQKVRSFKDLPETPGTYKMMWGAKRDDGTKMPSGVYIYQLKTSKGIQTKKMIFLK